MVGAYGRQERLYLHIPGPVMTELALVSKATAPLTVKMAWYRLAIPNLSRVAGGVHGGQVGRGCPCNEAAYKIATYY